uniref:Uncharacterized protein n=1 Tax=Anguilla anguilla TaxID=7936 RepID=A0A0E9V5W3_ANGAN
MKTVTQGLNLHRENFSISIQCTFHGSAVKWFSATGHR